MDLALVAERIEQGLPARVHEGEPVGRAVLGIDVDEELRSGRQRAGERLAAVLGAVAAVDEHERDPVERGRGEVPVFAISTNPVVSAPTWS